MSGRPESMCQLFGPSASAVRDVADQAGPANLWRSQSIYHNTSKTVTAAILFPARPLSGRLRITLMNATQRIAMRLTTELYRPKCQGPCSPPPFASLARSARKTGIVYEK